MRLGTQCIHAGSQTQSAGGALNTPILTSTAYEYLDAEDPPYQRYFNTLNQRAVVEKLCALEHGEDGLVFASGMAAISTVLLSFVSAGDHVVLQQDLYGGTHAFVAQELTRLGVEASFVPTDPAALRAAITPRTRLIYVETPTNPLLKIIDLQAVGALGREAGVVTAVDNTFASPVNQTPLALGLDISLHSGTKYLGGHTDLQCGAIVASARLVERMRQTASNFGGSLNAESCYLLERSLKTLHLRVERQTANAGALAEFLQAHPRVRVVNYPGLSTHPDHTIARRQMHGFGAMLSFELAPEAGDPVAFQRRLQLIPSALSLGGLETKICSPAATSHAKMDPAARECAGISDSLLRLSVGAEDVEDLKADLGQALAGGSC